MIYKTSANSSLFFSDVPTLTMHPISSQPMVFTPTDPSPWNNLSTPTLSHLPSQPKWYLLRKSFYSPQTGTDCPIIYSHNITFSFSYLILTTVKIIKSFCVVYTQYPSASMAFCAFLHFSHP